jgi:hypothetical protein
MKRAITFFYANSIGFSGQYFATKILIQELNHKNWQVSEILTPAINRIDDNKGFKKVFEYLKFSGYFFSSLLKGCTVALSKKIIYINLGQSRFGLLRDGFPLLIRSFIVSESKAVVSLHGSLFLTWLNNSLDAKLFRQIVQAARYVTILGLNHQTKLIELGVPQEKIIWLDNTCLLNPICESEIRRKHQIKFLQKNNNQSALSILYLSNLLETKGYVEFLEAISQLASNSQLPIAVVLCGKIVDKKEDEHRFTNPYEARQWIEKQITQINQSDYIRLRWVNGAVGEDKAKLFQEAHIFVLPSRYLVEAQPIVILEALASGCAVITTKIGEIPTTVNEETAFLLDECSPAAIAEAIRELSHNQKRRQELALNGLKLFQERFSYEKHIAQWESLLETFYS